MGDFIFGIFSGLLIAFIGFVGTEYLKIRWLRQSVARALLAEATAARENHLNVIGRHLDEIPDTTLPTQRVVIGSHHPFPIFNQLCVHLGVFPKEDAYRLAQGYSEALGFVHSLSFFMDRMFRLDELAVSFQRAEAAGNVQLQTELRREWDILNQSQIHFLGFIKSRNRRVTGELYDQVNEVLGKYGK
jgi:hypothetical protein